MKKTSITLSIALLSTLAFTRLAQAHCEVPCGVYTDQMRIVMIEEDCKTIEKGMTKIASGKESANQTTRWIMTKEDHANKIQHIVSQYFMTQRIKPDHENYAEKLQSLHRMLLSAMKCKQTTDLANVEALRSELDTFNNLYFGDH